MVCKPIPVPLEDARFRKSEQFIIKAHFLSRVAPLKRNVTQGMICSVFPKGWFRNALGKENNLNIVALYFEYLTRLKVFLNPPQKRLSNITSSLLGFRRTLHGWSLLENAGAILLNTLLSSQWLLTAT